jgi:hypothetical protein
MKFGLLTETRFFADHYQFYVRDTAVKALDALMSDFPMVGGRQGVDETGPFQFFMFGTFADLNAHWLRLVVSETAPAVEDYEFVACVQFRMKSNELAIDSIDPEPALTVSLPKGDYSLYVCAKNVGADPNDDAFELPDDEFKKLPCESYDLIFVPSAAESYGVLRQPDPDALEAARFRSLESD